jgi:hypothetical protein
MKALLLPTRTDEASKESFNKLINPLSLAISLRDVSISFAVLFQSAYL